MHKHHKKLQRQIEGLLKLLRALIPNRNCILTQELSLCFSLMNDKKINIPLNKLITFQNWTMNQKQRVDKIQWTVLEGDIQDPMSWDIIHIHLICIVGWLIGRRYFPCVWERNADNLPHICSKLKGMFLRHIKWMSLRHFLEVNESGIIPMKSRTSHLP